MEENIKEVLMRENMTVKENINGKIRKSILENIKMARSMVMVYWK